MDHKATIIEAVADSRGLARKMARLGVLIERSGDAQLGAAFDALEGQRGALCANLRAIAHAAHAEGLIGDDMIALASEPKDGGK
jgi:hypothetical protein